MKPILIGAWACATAAAPLTSSANSSFEFLIAPPSEIAVRAAILPGRRDADSARDGPAAILARPGMSESTHRLSELAAPRGTYPHFRRAGDFIFVSGLSSRRADNAIVGASVDAMGTTQLDIRVQTRAVIEKLATILDAAGASLRDVVDICAFLVDMNDFGGYNEVYAEHFATDGPARTTVAVHQLPHPHMRIEIKAVAFRQQAAKR